MHHVRVPVPITPRENSRSSCILGQILCSRAYPINASIQMASLGYIMASCFSYYVVPGVLFFHFKTVRAQMLDRAKLSLLLPMQLRGPSKLLFHMNGSSWLMFHNFLDLLKQTTTSLSEAPAPVPLAK